MLSIYCTIKFLNFGNSVKILKNLYFSFHQLCVFNVFGDPLTIQDTTGKFILFLVKRNYVIQTERKNSIFFAHTYFKTHSNKRRSLHKEDVCILYTLFYLKIQFSFRKKCV